MDLDLSYNSDETGNSSALEFKTTLSYSGAKISGEMELFIFVPSDLKIKAWSKNQLFADFTSRFSLPGTTIVETTTSNLVYKISLLQRLVDDFEIQKLKGLPVHEIQRDILTHARIFSSLFEQFIQNGQNAKDINLVVGLAQKVLTNQRSAQLPGMKELTLHLKRIMESNDGSAPADDFVLSPEEMPVDVYNRNSMRVAGSALVGKLPFTPDRVRVLNERNIEFGVFEDWFRIVDVSRLPSRVLKAVQGAQKNHDVLNFKRHFSLKPYLKNELPCGITETLKFSLQKVIQPKPLEIFAYANISMAGKGRARFFRRQSNEFAAKFFKIGMNADGIERIQQIK